MSPSKTWIGAIGLALLIVYGIGLFGRNLWNPDEPREADLSWRMSWQNDLAVPTLAGRSFCEKPPFTYWVAAASIGLFGSAPWAMRLPNLFYALLTAWALAAISRRWLGGGAALVAAVASASLLLCYQTAIWLATDAPLMSSAALALLGLSRGFYARDRSERLRGYWLMHAAMAAGFLCKSVAAWLVPVLCLIVIALWERRTRELLRWELWSGVALQALLIAPWIWFVYIGPHGPENLKVFFWNNLVGRFTAIDAPPQLQYAKAHRNSPGKYLFELPLYLFPWTLLVIGALRQAWRDRRSISPDARVMRVGVCAFFPSLAILSAAATARNVYLAPAVLGLALLLAWWAWRCERQRDAFDVVLLRATAAMLLIATVLALPVMLVVGTDALAAGELTPAFVLVTLAGLIAAAILSIRAGSAASGRPTYQTLGALALAYCALLIGPVSQVYGRVDGWQDLASVSRAVKSDVEGSDLILYSPDETTLAVIDLYGPHPFDTIAVPDEARALSELKIRLSEDPAARALIMLDGRALTPTLSGLAARFAHDRYIPNGVPAWIGREGFRLIKLYAVPNGRRYALIGRTPTA